jgi:hypothetical protein
MNMSQEDIKKICNQAIDDKKDLLITVYNVGTMREREPIPTEQLRFRPTSYDYKTDVLKGMYVDSETLKSHTDEELERNFIISAEIVDNIGAE